MSRKDYQQPRLFDGCKITRNRRTYKRVKRSLTDNTAHLRFLRTYRMIADSNNGKVKIKELQDKFRIGHFARKALPSDLLTIDEALITEDYAEAWKSSLYDYYKDCDRQGQGVDFMPAEPIIVMPEEVNPSEPCVLDILTEIKRLADDFIANATNQLERAKALLL